MFISEGSPIPLFVVLDDGSTDRMVTAEILSPVTGETIASEILLFGVAGQPGMYRTSAATMPGVANILAVYRVYDDDEVTLLDTITETFSLPPSSAAAAVKIFAEEIMIYLDDAPLIATIENSGDTLIATIEN